MVSNIFVDVGIIIIIATVLAYFTKLLRQPLIIAYLVAGVIIGPLGLSLITNSDSIAMFSEMGIALLLFLVGLEMNFKKIKTFGRPVLIAALGQMAVTFVFGYLVAAQFFSGIAVFYIAAATVFSSTMIVIKLLSDKHELDTLHGRLILGILLIQDLVAVFLLAILNVEKITPFIFLAPLVKGILLVSSTFFIALFILPPIFKIAAKSQELLFISALSWCFAISLLAYYLNFSVVIGAFIAGISLAPLQYNVEIVSKIRPLRDFFVTLFFVALGMQMVAITKADLVPAVIISLFVLIGSPILVMVVLGLCGFKKRNSFLTAIGIAQTSEFSVILAIQGFLLGHITAEIVSVIAIVTGITITVTAYYIKYDNKLYRMLSRFLKIFEFRKIHHLELTPEEGEKFDAVVFGCDRIGYNIIKKLGEEGLRFVAVDFNPDVISSLRRMNINCIYGDFGDHEILEKIPLRGLKLAISTIPSLEDNLFMIKKIREVNRKAIIMATSHNIDEAFELYGKGADYVIMPHFLGGDYVSQMLGGLNASKVERAKFKHLNELKKRKEMRHEHPSSRN